MGMKKTLKTMALLLMAAVVTGVMGCGSDDPSYNDGVLENDGSLRVASVGECKFYYGTNGLLNYFRIGSNRYELNNSKDTLEAVDLYDGKVLYYNVSFSKQGYLLTTQYAALGSDFYGTWKETSESKLAYDGDGHLSQISVAYSESGVDNAISYSGSGTMTYALTWQNGNLMQVDVKDVYTEGDDVEHSEETWTYTYGNASYTNKHHQYAPSVVAALGEEDYYLLESALAYVGMLGKGTASLPDAAIRNFRDYYSGHVTEQQHYFDYSYSFNANGAIADCTVSGHQKKETVPFAYEDTRADGDMPDFAVQHRELAPLFFRAHHQRGK